MPRHCISCKVVTPPYHVNFCPNCGFNFRRSSTTLPSQHTPVSRNDLTSLRNLNPFNGLLRLLNSNNDKNKIVSGSCAYKLLCVEYLKSLNWDQALFNRTYNHCYCANCYSLMLKDTLVEAGSLYVIPRGWCRFGLQVDKVRTEVDHIWRDWIVTYHGTSPEAARSIVAHRQFLIPGDRSINGETISIKPGHIRGKNEIYTSPTIAYASHRVYCPDILFHSSTNDKIYNARVVLQCRQEPGTFQVQPETIEAKQQRICPIIPNDKIEIFTTVRASIVPYGLLIHLTEIS